jgi:hypothetical protein
MEEEFKDFGYMIVSNQVAVENSKVGFMYRETPDNNIDSGWRIFSGEEDEAYIDNPNNFGYYDSVKILEIDPSIESLLSSPNKTAFERLSPEGEFTQVFDFEFAEDFDEEEDDSDAGDEEE